MPSTRKISLVLATAGAGVICLAPGAHAAAVPPDPVRVTFEPGLPPDPIRVGVSVVPPDPINIHLEINPCVRVGNLGIHPCIRVGSPPTDTHG